MMLAAITWKCVALGCAGVSIGLLVFALVGSPKSIVYIGYGKYTAYLASGFKALRYLKSPARIVVAQVSVLLGLATLAVFWRPNHVWPLAVVVAIGPAVWLERKLARRIQRLDEQADGFATALMNALKATPSIAAALDSVAGMMEGPIAQELSFALKEIRLGKTLDEALVSVGLRSRSAKTATVLASILIGRQVGGNLPNVLERTAATLREMERLEGVVRQKTAESRAQMWAMTLAPFVISYGMMQFDENFFEPLTTTPTGRGLIAAAVLSYVAALVAARKILAVDI
jgi:tight adherence protein B